MVNSYKDDLRIRFLGFRFLLLLVFSSILNLQRKLNFCRTVLRDVLEAVSSTAISLHHRDIFLAVIEENKEVRISGSWVAVCTYGKTKYAFFMQVSQSHSQFDEGQGQRSL